MRCESQNLLLQESTSHDGDLSRRPMRWNQMQLSGWQGNKDLSLTGLSA